MVLVALAVLVVALVVAPVAREEARNSDEAESKSGADVSARNCSPRNLPATRLWTRRSPRVRS